MNHKFISICLVLIISCCFSFSQDTGGIHFESGLAWNKILAKAKQENKPIFMDCYATWCGPCKYMDKNIYSLKSVGEYFNKNFINVKVQMDSTARDTLFVRDWYKDALLIKGEYKIAAYPSYLFFSADGKPIHKFSGGYEADIFLSKTADALNPDKQYYTLLTNWKNHKEDSVYLLNALVAASDAWDEKSQREIAPYYMSSLREPITMNNILLFYPLVLSEKDPAFQLFLQHVTKIDLLMKQKNYAEHKLAEIIFKEEVAPVLSKKKNSFSWGQISGRVQEKYKQLDKDLFAASLDSWFQDYIAQEIRSEAAKRDMSKKDWDIMSKALKQKYPGYDCQRLLLNNEGQYYFERELWEEAARASTSLLNQYATKMDSRSVNNIYWNVIFLHSGNKEFLEAALRNMEVLVKNSPTDFAGMDTYANLLYKIGRQKEAIGIETKVVEMGGKGYENEFQINLDKMQKGLPTWSVPESTDSKKN